MQILDIANFALWIGLGLCVFAQIALIAFLVNWAIDAWRFGNKLRKWNEVIEQATVYAKSLGIR